MDHAVPRHLRARRREDMPDQTWSARIDVAVGLDVAGRNVPDALEDGRDTGIVADVAIMVAGS